MAGFDQLPPPPILARAYGALVRVPRVKSGLTILSFNALTRLLLKRAPDRVRAKMFNEYDIEVDPDDYHGRVLMFFGSNDPKVQGVATALSKPGEVFLDIGANYSSIGIAVAGRVGPTGAVHLFEPQPDLGRVVRTVLESSGLRNIELHPVGLMDEDGVLELAIPGHHSGLATFMKGEKTKKWETVRLEVRNIADYVPSLVEGKVFGAKVDIEGAEPLVLPWLVSRPNLAYLVYESAHHHEELWQIVRGGNLTVFGLARRPVRLRVELCREFQDTTRYHDLLGVRLRDGVEPPDACHPSALRELLMREC